MTRSDGTPADDTPTEGSPPEVGVREATQQAVTATLSHADDLLAAAGRLMPELPHLAFHFAALALEEVGRATLLVMLEAAGATTNGGLEGAQEDHVAKLFWALWGPSFGRAAISRAQIDEHRNLARYVHERRKAGLYFNPEGPPPRAAITVDETETLIEMAVARVGMERSHVYGPLDDARAADVRWFVERTRDGQRRYEIFAAASMERLHDGRRHTHLERTRQDARDQFPDSFGHGDVGVFDPMSDDTGALVLEVPFVCADDHTTTSADIALPVREPITVELASAETRLLATREAELPGSRGSAIAVDLDVSMWYGDRRVIAPLGAKLDGRDAGISWGDKGLHGPSPEPASTVLVPCATPSEAHLLALRGAFVQLRGPWRIPIAVS